MMFLKALILAIVFAMPSLVAQAQMRPPIPLTPQQFAIAPSGQSVKIVIRVDSLSRSTLRGELLLRQSDLQYETSAQHVTLYYPDETPIVMGSASDIVPGAVVFVDGVVTSKDHADVKQLLVVTKYVTVSAPKQ